jgi:hypothetical protein
MTWVLEGTVCVGTESTPSIEDETFYKCPSGFASTDDPITSSTICKKPVAPVQKWKCHDGYSTTDNPVTQNSVCTKTAAPTSEWKWVCASGPQQSGDSEGVESQTCRNGSWTLVKVYSCPNEYTTSDDPVKADSVCTKTKPAEKDGAASCPAVVSGTHFTPPPVVTCPDEETPSVIDDTTYMCPEGFSSDDDPINVDTTCTRPLEETAATCPPGDTLTPGLCVTPIVPAVVPGGPTPVIDFCPNLEGVQWENYDCNTPQVSAAEAVVPVAAPAAATVPEEPVVVAAPEEATVPAAVAVPQKATVPAAVPAGDGSSDKSGPNTGLLLLALVATGVCLFATGRLVATRSR